MSNDNDGWYLPDPEGEPFISVAECARRLGINRSTLHRQVERGLVRSYETGLGRTVVRLSEVIEDRRRNLAPGHAYRHRRERRHASAR
jgi:DNA-binding IclR family transcriptional regulator